MVREVGEIPKKQKSYSVHIDLQSAFLTTFPKNVCLAADEDLEYPFFVMIRDKSLLKIHGSSIVCKFTTKPKWACCQNLVMSSVTGRAMARILVPIDTDLLKSMDKKLFNDARKMDEQKLPKKRVFEEVPTAIIRFFRSKNHDEYIQQQLKTSEAYLETDEDKDRILYFYLNDPKDSAKRAARIEAAATELEAYARDTIKKKNYLFSVSDRTRMQVSEEGTVVDVLGSQEFTTFIIKSYNPDILNRVREFKDALNIEDRIFTMISFKDKNFTNVCVNKKSQAFKLFNLTNRFCRERKIGCRLPFTQAFRSAAARLTSPRSSRNGNWNSSGTKARRTLTRGSTSSQKKPRKRSETR